jgi:phage terminase small subunit
MKQAPRWLDPLGKDYWHEHRPHLDLEPTEEASFAVLCQIYAEWRDCDEPTKKRRLEGSYLNFARHFGLTPQSRAKQARPEAIRSELDVFLEERETA